MSFPVVLEKSGIALQERDFEVLRGLYESRMMTRVHISKIYFGGADEYTKKRIQQLKSADLIGERPRLGQPSLLYLTSSALRLLREYGHLAAYPQVKSSTLAKRTQIKELTLRHELDVLDVKAAFASEISKGGTLKLQEFTTWPLLSMFEVYRSAKRKYVPVEPDGFIRVGEPGQDGEKFEHSFFLEVDRSNESQRIVAEKAACYADFYRQGGFAARLGLDVSQIEEAPFCVLIVFLNEQRRNNAAEELLRLSPPVLKQALLTTLGEVKSAPLGNIWITPANYRQALMGTPFDVTRGLSKTIQTNRARDLLVESKVLKLSLFC